MPALELASRADPLNVGLKLLLARQCAEAGQATRAELEYQNLAKEQPTPEAEGEPAGATAGAAHKNDDTIEGEFKEHQS